MANVFKVCVLFLVHVLCCFPWLLLSYNFCQKRGCPLCLRVATAATSPPPLPCDLIKAEGRKPRSYSATLYCVGAQILTAFRFQDPLRTLQPFFWTHMQIEKWERLLGCCCNLQTNVLCPRFNRCSKGVCQTFSMEFLGNRWKGCCSDYWYYYLCWVNAISSSHVISVNGFQTLLFLSPSHSSNYSRQIFSYLQHYSDWKFRL